MLPQGGTLSDIPSQCDIFLSDGFFGGGLTVEKLELEVLDSMDFVIPSHSRQKATTSF